MSDDFNPEQSDLDHVVCEECRTPFTIAVRSMPDGSSWNQRDTIPCPNCADRGRRVVIWEGDCMTAQLLPSERK